MSRPHLPLGCVGGVGAVGCAQCSVDPWWNPSVEFQAIDRCVRFGQQRPVVVCRFFIANSIEDRLREIQATKIGITNSVLNEDVEVRCGGCAVTGGLTGSQSAFLISKVDTRVRGCFCERGAVCLTVGLRACGGCDGCSSERWSFFSVS